jgi:bifunctional isochorismate lyase/aryl carrier protein
MTSIQQPLTRKQVLADLAETLELEEDAQPVDENADLVSLGLDSIRMMHLMVLWRRQGTEVTLQELSANPTLSHWWTALDLPARREQG